MASVDFEQVSKRFDNVEVVQDLSLQVRDVVLYAGVIQQLGTPQDLYERPANNFVAGFIGRKVTLGIRPEHLEDEITLSFDLQHCHLFDPHDGRSITSLLREESSGSTEQAHDAEALGA